MQSYSLHLSLTLSASPSPSPALPPEVSQLESESKSWNSIIIIISAPGGEKDATFVKLIRLPSKGFHLFTPFTHYLSTVLLCLHQPLRLGALPVRSVWFINQVKTLSGKRPRRALRTSSSHAVAPDILGHSRQEVDIFRVFVFSFSGFRLFFVFRSPVLFFPTWRKLLIQFNFVEGLEKANFGRAHK